MHTSPETREDISATSTEIQHFQPAPLVEKVEKYFHSQFKKTTSGNRIELRTKDTILTERLIDTFMNDTEEIHRGKFPMELKKRPEALFYALKALKALQHTSYTEELFRKDLSLCTTQKHKEQLFIKLINTISDFRALKLIFNVDMSENKELIQRVFGNSSQVHIQSFHQELIKAFEQEMLYRAMEWKDNVEFTLSLDRTIQEQCEKVEEECTAEKDVYKNPDSERSFWLKKPTKEQLEKLETGTYFKLVEYVLPFLLEHIFKGEKKVFIGTKYCDVRGNDMYIRDEKNPSLVYAYDLTLGRRAYQNKQQTSLRFIGKEQAAASNYIMASRVLEHNRTSQVEKRILFLEPEIWEGFMRDITELIFRGEIYLPKSSEMNREKIEEAFAKRSGFSSGLETYLRGKIEHAFDPKSMVQEVEEKNAAEPAA